MRSLSIEQPQSTPRKFGIRSTRSVIKQFSIAIGFALLTTSSQAAVTSNHLDRAVDLVTHLREHLVAGDGEDLNFYGGSWSGEGDSELIVDPGNHQQGEMPFNRSRCGSFITKLLNHCYGWDWNQYLFMDTEIGQWVDTASPTAHRYMELIKQKKGFRGSLTKLVQMLPGDIIVKRYDDYEGHVFLIQEIFNHTEVTYPMIQGVSDPDFVGNTFVTIRIIDSSTGKHTNDSRIFGNSSTLGAGTGLIGLMMNDTGTVVGHSWTIPDVDYNSDPEDWVSQVNTKIETLDDAELVIGRLDLPFILDVLAPSLPGGMSYEPAVHFGHLKIGRQLIEEITIAQTLDIKTETEGSEINQWGTGSPTSDTSSFIQFGDVELGIAPANHTTSESLVTLLLEHAYGFSWNDHSFFDTRIGRWNRTANPSPDNYVDLITQGVGFAENITLVGALQPGDIMAIRETRDTAGHVATIDHVDWSKATAYPVDLGESAFEFTGCWYVPIEVLDSTPDNDGIGYGTMGILMNTRHQIVAYTWSTPESNIERQPEQWLRELHRLLQPQAKGHLAIGRL